MIIIDWPSVLRPTQATAPWLEANVASAGQSLTGQERFLVTDAGRWRHAISVPVRRREHVLAWRGLMAMTEGRAHVIRLPICDGLYDPLAVSGLRHQVVRGIPDSGIPHDDGAPHSDGAGYGTALVHGVVTMTTAQGATSITVVMPLGLMPEPGQCFSDGDRMYRIKGTVLVSGDTWRLTFLPRLRARSRVAARCVSTGCTA